MIRHRGLVSNKIPFCVRNTVVWSYANPSSDHTRTLTLTSIGGPVLYPQRHGVFKNSICDLVRTFNCHITQTYRICELLAAELPDGMAKLIPKLRTMSLRAAFDFGEFRGSAPSSPALEAQPSPVEGSLRQSSPDVSPQLKPSSADRLLQRCMSESTLT